MCRRFDGGRPAAAGDTKNGPGFRTVFMCFRSELLGDDSLARANACAGAAVDALVGVDDVDVAGRDGLYRALADAGTAGNARISDFVSHCVLLFMVNVCVGANIAIYLIISKPV